MNNKFYYSVDGDRELVTAESIDEAMVEWIEQDVCDRTLDSLPESVQVCEWKLPDLEEDNNLSQWMFDSLIEDIECNYSSEYSMYEYSPNQETKEAWDNFVKCFVKDFYPTVLHKTKKVVKVDVMKWLVDNNSLHYFEGN